MSILKFIFATVVTALSLDSLVTHAMVVAKQPELITAIVLVGGAKILGSMILVCMWMWGRSAWRGWHG